MSLPIDAIRDEFERCLDDSKRLVVTAETGAGKSTRVPVWLAERLEGLILVVEPRRVACHALAEYLAATRHEPVGAWFGSRVRFSDRSGPGTRVLFCTPGVALRMLTGSDVPGAIVVDEFHERSWQMDLVVAAAASLPRLRSVPLILTSATIDAESAATTLGARTLHATGRTFPVEVFYDRSSLEPSVQDLGARVGSAIVRVLDEREGDVLVFLPGMKEIRAVEVALGRRDEDVLVVHGSNSSEAMRRVFAASKRRRIYLATNVAETSITLPGVRVVIDSGLAKTRLHRAGRAVLATVPIAESSMQQRAGRAGRVAAGVCIRLWSERFKAEPYQRPEIERVELDDLVLQAADLGFHGDALERATWITKPPEFAVQRALQRLRSLVAIDGTGLTERGKQLAKLPVSAEEAGLLVGAPRSIDATLCDLVAILQARGSFLANLRDLSPQARERAQDQRIELLAGVADEVTMNLRLLRDGVANTHHLSRRRLDEARAIRRQLRDLIGARGESTEGLAAYILSRLPETGFVKRPRADKSRGRNVPFANGSIEVKVYPFEPIDPEVEPRKHHAAVILETEWVASSTGVFGIGRMVLPTELEVFAAAGLGEAKIAEITLEKKSRGRLQIAAVREVQLAGVKLTSGKQELTGADLNRAVATLIFDNRIFKGAGDAVRDALHGWSVLAHWKGDPLSEYERRPEAVPADEQDWLASRLTTLGVETTADLALIDSADLLPDLEAETGVPAWVSEPLLKGFPRVWSNQGGKYACKVSPESRTVQLEPLDSKARKLKEPRAGDLPRFHGFRVTYLQGSRRLTLLLPTPRW
jgi:ATP-dependent RNA helicase HrpB